MIARSIDFIITLVLLLAIASQEHESTLTIQSPLSISDG
jgi:hypothetical protein